MINSGEMDDEEVDSEAGGLSADSIADEFLISFQSLSDMGW